MKSLEKIKSPENLKKLINEWHQQGKKVVFTNGCFDILHAGHADYMEKARELGDKLVVGLNTDASIKRIKGPERPIVEQSARARLLAALEFVDAVTFFDEDTPYQLIKNIVPDILVKGKDYEPENIIGADIVLGNGGEVKTIELTEGYSTTDVIGKIKKLK